MTNRHRVPDNLVMRIEARETTKRPTNTAAATLNICPVAEWPDHSETAHIDAMAFVALISEHDATDDEKGEMFADSVRKIWGIK